MPVRTITIDGVAWQVVPAGRLTASVGDEFALLFTRLGTDGAREQRVTRYSPMGARSREQSLADLDDEALRILFESSQPSVRSPEAGYRA
ncbi:MAG: hypothetical protein MUE41_01535 [Gemmatimonadaceae bacterium]|jgi:hypothetical protein|nr:hypothetical protein [Gemmatimonadaceae bacterium]